MKFIFSTVIFLLLSSTNLFAQKTYTLDKYHARVGFSVVHFGISHVEGNFKIIDATLDSKKVDFTDAVITFTADVNSINTDVEYRDNDLKSVNYFDAVKFPTINFKSTSFKKIASKNYRLLGNITIHGITKPIVFNVIYNGQAVTAMKKPTAGFTITGQINRLDFSVGGPVITSGISNKIELRSNVEFTISD
ncbi:MAG: YceI family protein [Ferruginibacter sp.]|nr:YceI family protein [Ferruginibacter sp.]